MANQNEQNVLFNAMSIKSVKISNCQYFIRTMVDGLLLAG